VRTRSAGLIDVAQIARSPAWLPLDLTATGNIELLRLDEASYRAASFLDQRLLAGSFERGHCSAAILREAAQMLPVRAHFVFHIGHVGSTLIARLIGEHAALFALREPALLRTLRPDGDAADPSAAVRLGLSLLSRTWHPTQRAVIKVTSFVNEIARSLLEVCTDAAVVVLFVQPLQYLRGILAGANSRTELRQLAPARWQRLLRIFGGAVVPAPASEGEWIAMSWLCEMATLRAAVERQSREALWLDFDVFLQAPAPCLLSVFNTLGAAATTAQIGEIVRGPLMRQYSKAPEFAYDAALRREVLAQAEHEHAPEIRRGMQWLHAAAAGSAVARTLVR
jgi:hypothetical protein